MGLAVVPRKCSHVWSWPGTDIQVGLPYVRARAQDYFERLGGGQAGDTDGEAPGAAVTVVIHPAGTSRCMR